MPCGDKSQLFAKICCFAPFQSSQLPEKFLQLRLALTVQLLHPYSLNIRLQMIEDYNTGIWIQLLETENCLLAANFGQLLRRVYAD